MMAEGTASTGVLASWAQCVPSSASVSGAGWLLQFAGSSDGASRAIVSVSGISAEIATWSPGGSGCSRLTKISRAASARLAEV